ncbi:MAG: hypothetical protein ACHQT8_02200 [Chlamydiales bacterium]
MENNFLEIHEELKRSMQKEITLMRDLLANMHQEELSLLMHDRTSWNKIMEERAKIVQNLGPWRSKRTEATDKLIQHRDKEKKKTPQLEELLPPEQQSSCEILSLRDQLMALTERMNSQNCRNETLYKQVENKLVDLPFPNYRERAPNPSLVPVPRKKRSSVITF